jgi:hypothetical protein
MVTMTQGPQQHRSVRTGLARALVGLLVVMSIGAAWWVHTAAARELFASRISNTVDAIHFIKAREDWSRYLRRRYTEAATRLRHATSESLSSPSCIVAYAIQREIHGELRWLVTVRWLSNEPLARGVRVQTPDKTQSHDFCFPSGLLLANSAAAPEVLLFSAMIYEHDGTGPWNQLSRMLGTPLEVVLLGDNAEALCTPQELVVLAH